MVNKSTVKKSPSVGRQLANIEQLVRTGFQQTDKRFEQVDKRFARADQRFSGIAVELRELKREMNNRFERVEDSISQLSSHVDGFMKLHETLDIEARDERADESF